jgi:hypothetical protein
MQDTGRMVEEPLRSVDGILRERAEDILFNTLRRIRESGYPDN